MRKESGDKNEKENTTEKVTDIDYAQCAVPAEEEKDF